MAASSWRLLLIIFQLSNQNLSNCGAGLSMLSIHPSIHPGAVRGCLKKKTLHFWQWQHKRRKVRVKSHCQVCSKSVESWFPLITPTKTHKLFSRRKKRFSTKRIDCTCFQKVWSCSIYSDTLQSIKRPVRSEHINYFLKIYLFLAISCQEYVVNK